MCLPASPGPGSPCSPDSSCGPGSPCGPGPRAAVAEVPSTATPLAQQIWRGIHEGAHLDHLSVLARSGEGAPSPAEFGDGLLAAESYAMAVEILTAVECLLAGEGAAVWQLGAGLVERATRLPGGSDPAPEFTDLPTLAEVYVLGPLHVLAGVAPARALAPAHTLPAELITALCARWRAACAAYPSAAAFADAGTELLGRSPGAGSAFLVQRPVTFVPMFRPATSDTAHLSHVSSELAAGIIVDRYPGQNGVCVHDHDFDCSCTAGRTRRYSPDSPAATSALQAQLTPRLRPPSGGGNPVRPPEPTGKPGPGQY
jgi:hypothetical protein